MKFVIEKLDNFGRGIVKLNNKIVFVPNVVIGDEVEIKIVEEKKNYSIAKVIDYIKKSQLRRNFCKYSDKCGGCNICNMNYDEQLKYKKQKICDIVLHSIGDNIKINDIIYSEEMNYRNKITLHVSNNKIGLYELETHRLVEIDECKLINKNINNIIKRLKTFLELNNSNINKIIIKNTTLNETMLIIFGDINKQKLIEEFNDVNSIIVNDKLIFGDKYIREKINDYTFLISQNSFFQVNSYNVSNLYNEVSLLVSNDRYKKIVDLYCGTGTIGIFVAKYAREVIGIEVTKDAIDDANINKKINNIENISFINGKVEDNLNKISSADLIIVDPPRNGLHKKVTETILNVLPEKLIYISCDPITLCRDLNILKERYNIKSITPVDMFPNTYHCESIAVLERG